MPGSFRELNPHRQPLKSWCHPQSPEKNTWRRRWGDAQGQYIEIVSASYLDNSKICWLVGWLVERLTAVAVVHRHNLHQQISGSAPETSLLPSLPASGGLLEQKQEQEWKDSKSPTVTEHQPLAKHKPSKATPETPTD